MEQNKTGKYLKYAIGEIVLVVIGILIALSINNWNEQRKQQQKTDYYLKALTHDIEKNLETIKAKNIAINKDLEVLRSINNRLRNENATIDSLIHIATNEFSLFVYSFSKLNDNTYQTLKSTGHIEYLDTWLQEELQQLNFIQNDLYETDSNMGGDYSITVIDYFKVFPGNTINKSLLNKVNDQFTEGQHISTFTNIVNVKNGMYHSILRRSKKLEERTAKLLDNLKQTY